MFFFLMVALTLWYVFSKGEDCSFEVETLIIMAAMVAILLEGYIYDQMFKYISEGQIGIIELISFILIYPVGFLVLRKFWSIMKM